MTDLSIIIPARNEIFLQQTIDNIFANAEADTEVIAVLDGYWPDTPIPDHPKLKIIHHTESVGQRAATNDGVKLSRAKYIMKADAHCAFDKGFDRKLMSPMRYHWTVVPRMYNLHAFDWQCEKCGHRSYQGAMPVSCEKECGNTTDFKMVTVWEPKPRPVTDSMMFDNKMLFQYWERYKKRQNPKKYKDIVDTMSFLGACWMINRERHWELEGLDENHGGWGQLGTEIACKSWLSGGRLCVNRSTWFAHMFRTGNFRSNDGRSSFPYQLSGNQVERARKYSRDLWFNDKWPKAKYPLSWLIDKFNPVPTWHD